MDGIASTTWREFFDAHAPHYEENEFTKWTKTEVSFLLDLFPLAPGSRVLDLGCGTGRHSIELASRGYSVVGIDISPGMLEVARGAANARSVEVEFIESAIQDYRASEPFDLAICLCEGGFGLSDPGVDAVASDLGILRVAFASLKPGAGFVLSALNGYSVIRRLTDEHTAIGSFDPATMESRYVDTLQLPEGERQFLVHERLFIPPEVVAMMRHVGFEVRHVWGGTAGEWGKRPVKLDEIEMMVVAERPE
jgi:2-polyprenyl-3-methyl-5-hydroxy-6-metoxy-1,4-benzoquinol methylase